MSAEGNHNHGNDRFYDEIRDNAKEIAKTFKDELEKLKDPSSFAAKLGEIEGKADEWVKGETKTLTSYVDFKDLEQIEKDIGDLNKISPEFDSLMSDRTLEAVRDVGSDTVLTGAPELKALQGLSDNRRTVIAELNSSRQKLIELKDAYSKTEQTARAISGKLGEQIGDPAIEVSCLINGRNCALSWGDLEANLIPSLKDRVNAAEAALNRVDSARQFASKDLDQFDLLRSSFQSAYDRVTNSPGGLNVGDIKNEMVDATARAEALATDYRRQAQEIRRSNARIAAVQRLLSLGTSLAGLIGAADAAGGRGETSAPAPAPSPSPGPTYIFKYNVLIAPRGMPDQPPVTVHPR